MLTANSALPRMQSTLVAVLERTRLQLHFKRVEIILHSAATPAGLCDRTRRRSLAQLHDYVQAGRFPQNTERTQQPIFIDHEGTHCAVGYLLAQNGHARLASRIAATRNRAYVRDLANMPGLLPALGAIGITAGEAALIQPGYGPRVPVGPEVQLPTDAPLSPIIQGASMAVTVFGIFVAMILLLLLIGIMIPRHIRGAVVNEQQFRRLAVLCGVLIVITLIGVFIIDAGLGGRIAAGW